MEYCKESKRNDKIKPNVSNTEKEILRGKEKKSEGEWRRRKEKKKFCPRKATAGLFDPNIETSLPNKFAAGLCQKLSPQPQGTETERKKLKKNVENRKIKAVVAQKPHKTLWLSVEGRRHLAHSSVKAGAISGWINCIYGHT